MHEWFSNSDLHSNTIIEEKFQNQYTFPFLKRFAVGDEIERFTMDSVKCMDFFLPWIKVILEYEMNDF